ncbi:MAG: hypothetical protein H8E36_04485 [Rhodospirillaceae bacterium]|nr:hypothetical protein [Rhodospirillaceae bacterium]MBL6942217.1 hypothetical protein [Rhodospirillales bacterium]
MIKKFISSAVLSIFMDKQAKEKYQAVKEGRQARKRGPVQHEQATNTAIPDHQGESRPMNRQELIESAMAVHKEKSKVLDELTVNERRKLQLIAMQAMKGKVGGST